jgi:tetratricopeptide (TPR) repeat protein
MTRTIATSPGVQDLLTLGRGHDGRLSVAVRCHRRLRGQYTGGAALIRLAALELMGSAAHLVARNAAAVLAVAPDLAGQVPPGPITLTNTASGVELTRFSAAERTREHANGITDVVLSWARTCHPEGVTVHLFDVDEADHTDRELASALRRRAAGTGLIVRSRSGTYATLAPVPDGLGAPSSLALAQAYIVTDGTSSDPAARAAYDALDDHTRATLHSARAQVLLDACLPGVQFGAVPYHLSRGTSASVEGVSALRAAVLWAFDHGFYHLVADLCRQGRELSRGVDEAAYRRFTHSLSTSLTYLGETDEAVALITEERCMTVDSTFHMVTAYALSMLNTRHLTPDERDADAALAWANTAIALADCRPDLDDRVIQGAFMRNARALVELHRGDIAGALELVDEAIAMADAHFGPQEHRLHRSVLAFNRARVLAALGRTDEALGAVTAVIAQDPAYDELYFERAAIRRSAGDLSGALADYDETIRLRPNLAEAYHNRADTYVELGDTERALADLDVALALEPDLEPALLARASLSLERGDHDGATRDIAHGLSTAPDSADLWAARGQLLLQQATSEDGLSQARGALDQAVELNPALVAGWGNRAIARYSLGDVAGAVADLDAAIGLAPSAALLLNRALAKEALGDVPGARLDVEAAADMPDADPGEISARLIALAQGDEDRPWAEVAS